MNAYVYSASIYCGGCGRKIAARLTAAGKEDTGDSEDYPQGPYADGGGEADSPQHCDNGARCDNALEAIEGGDPERGAVGAFLENPLTKDGYEYVRAALSEPRMTAAKEVWRDFYNLDDEDNWPRLTFSAVWSDKLDQALEERLRGILGSYEDRGFQNGYRMSAHAETDQDRLCDSFAHAHCGDSECRGGDAHGRIKRRYSHEGLRAFVRYLLEEIDPGNDPILDSPSRDGEDWYDAAHSLASCICETLAIELI